MQTGMKVGVSVGGGEGYVEWVARVMIFSKFFFFIFTPGYSQQHDRDGHTSNLETRFSQNGLFITPLAEVPEPDTSSPPTPF